jgi:transposase InsO family protein
MRRVGSPKLGLRHSNQKENPDAGFRVWPRYQNWKANSRIAARPQITKRRSAGPLSGAGGIARRRQPYHGPAAHIGCGASDRPTCRSRSRRSRSTVAPSSRPNSSKPVRQGIRLYELPPNRPQINGTLERCYGSCVTNSAATNCPAPSKPSSNTQKACSNSTNQYRPHGALAGQTPASYLKER